MQRSVLVFVILVVFASLVLAAKKPEQKHPSAENIRGTKVKEAILDKTPPRKPLKKEPNAKKPPIPQKNKDEQIGQETNIADEKLSANKKPAVPSNKNPNKKKPTADNASVPQPPKRGEKPTSPVKLEPDVVDNELSIELPRPPSPFNK